MEQLIKEFLEGPDSAEEAIAREQFEQMDKKITTTVEQLLNKNDTTHLGKFMILKAVVKDHQPKNLLEFWVQIWIVDDMFEKIKHLLEISKR